MTQEAFDRTAPSFSVEVESESGRSHRVVLDPGGSGDPLPADSVRALSFEYTDSDRQADRLKLTIDNFYLSNFDDPVWKKGGAIVARWGYPGRFAPARRLIITKVTGGLVLNVEARAESVLMNRVSRTRTFEAVTRSDVARRIAAENGYGPGAVDVEETEVVLPQITQAAQTDAQLLMRMAREEGFEFFVDFDGFHFHSRRTGSAPVRRIRYYTDQGMGDVLSFNVENDVTARPGRVRRRSRDPVEGADVEGVSDTKTAKSDGRTALSRVLEVPDPETPGATHVEKRVAQEDTAPASSPHREELTRHAAARQRRHQLAAVKLSLVILGDPLLLAKTVVQVEGLGQRLSQRYYVREVVHSFSSGYECKLSCISDGSGGHSTESRVARGLSLLDPGPPQQARQNAADAPESPAPTGSDGADSTRVLTQREFVNPETQETRTIYIDDQGRGEKGNVVDLGFTRGGGQ